MKERKLDMKWKPAGYLGSFVLELVFGRLVAMHRTHSHGDHRHGSERTIDLVDTDYWLYGRFCLTLFRTGVFIGSTRWILRYSNLMMKIGGALMLVMGILLFTDQMTQITIWLQQITPDWMINLT